VKYHYCKTALPPESVCGIHVLNIVNENIGGEIGGKLVDII